MSAETQAALIQAEKALADHEVAIEPLIRECREAVAAQIVDVSDTRAKAIAVEQSSVTRGLGREDVAEMREELRQYAIELAGEVSEGSGINWLMPDVKRGEYVHAALFGYLYGDRLDKFRRIMAKKGYQFSRGESFLAPQQFYGRTAYSGLDQALAILDALRQRVANARLADERSEAEDLWGS
ncbi:hypothetical protein [Gordonia polyisoprenivorans]|uniref:hypothetical protein n=1 Tax=Gordonia polyisoprenivorans TaxID=84595 RepID=UPI000377DEB3|nr:hypothetical protein [Gordonia polyisoprenivorans]